MNSSESGDLQAQGAPPGGVATALHCTQCGGELHPDEGQIFLTCPYCGATVYVDKSQVVFHWYVAPTLNEAEARSALFRWMSGSQTVKDLDQKAQVVGQSFLYFPLWYFKYKNSQGEQIVLQPAAATAITELAHLRLPAGDLRRYDSGLDAQAQPPTVPLEAAQSWLSARRDGALPGPSADGVVETAMVHVPVYLFQYAYRGQTYTALVEAASGGVLANVFPAKAEAPYLLVGGVTALVYLCLALIPIGGALMDTPGSLGISIGVCAGLGGLAAPILLAWALWVASKV